MGITFEKISFIYLYHASNGSFVSRERDSSNNLLTLQEKTSTIFIFFLYISSSRNGNTEYPFVMMHLDLVINDLFDSVIKYARRYIREKTHCGTSVNVRLQYCSGHEDISQWN